MTTPNEELRARLADLLAYVDRETCTHEETHRGGAIWTICDGCGKSWADDRGGFVPHEDAPPVAAARAALARQEEGREAAIDWRANFIHVSAMRYMDNGLMHDQAYEAAEQDARITESAGRLAIEVPHPAPPSAALTAKPATAGQQAAGVSDAVVERAMRAAAAEHERTPSPIPAGYEPIRRQVRAALEAVWPTAAGAAPEGQS